MSKKPILAAIFLIFIGIVFGVVLVSNFQLGVQPGFAGDPDVRLGAQSQVGNQNYKDLSKAFIQVSKAVSPSVVTITVVTKSKSRSSDLDEFFHFFGPNQRMPEESMQSGSGVIISSDGYILTNNHVVEDATDVEITLADKRQFKAKVIGTDPTTDLAVVKVDGKDLPAAAFGNSDNLDIGEWVLAIGNPLNLNGTVTAGIVSAIGRNIGIMADTKGFGIEDFIQTDAAINPGNSGGPLVNMNGEVVGINSAIATTNARYQGYGFAIPINLARAVAEDLIKTGKVRRGYIGVNITSVDPTMAKALGLPEAKGVLVQQVVKGGAGENAGLKERDVILSVDGKEVNQANELQTYVARKHPGDEVKLKVFRDGKTFDKTVTLRGRADEKLASNEEQNQSGESSGAERETPTKALTIDPLGMSVRPMTSDEKDKSSVQNGVVVSDVKHFGEAFNHRIQTGDIILEADKKEINSPRELKSIVDSHKSGDAILLRVKQGDTSAFIALQIQK